LSLRVLSSQPLEVSSPFVETVLLRRPDLGDLGLPLGRPRADMGDCVGAERALELVASESEVRTDADVLTAECLPTRGDMDGPDAPVSRLVAQPPERPTGHTLAAR